MLGERADKKHRALIEDPRDIVLILKIKKISQEMLFQIVFAIYVFFAKGNFSKLRVLIYRTKTLFYFAANYKYIKLQNTKIKLNKHNRKDCMCVLLI